MPVPSATSWSKPNGGNLKWQPAPLPIQFWCCRQRLLPVATLPRVAVAVAQLQLHSQHSLPLSLSFSPSLCVLHMSSKCSATNAPQNSRLRLQLQLQLRLCRLCLCLCLCLLGCHWRPASASRSTQCVVALVNILIIW